MTVKTFDFAYGHGRKQFSIDDAHILKEVRTEEFPPMTDVKQGILDAIYTRSAVSPSTKSSSPGIPSPLSATTPPALPTALTSCRFWSTN